MNDSDAKLSQHQKYKDLHRTPQIIHPDKNALPRSCLPGGKTPGLPGLVLLTAPHRALPPEPPQQGDPGRNPDQDTPTMGPQEAKRATHTPDAGSPAQLLGRQDRKGSEKFRGKPSGAPGVTERQPPGGVLPSSEQTRVPPTRRLPGALGCGQQTPAGPRPPGSFSGPADNRGPRLSPGQSTIL